MKTEMELIQSILDGEWRKFAILVDKYEAKVYGYVFYMMGNKEDAEEIVQDSFVKAYHSLNKFRGEAAFSTWITRIAHFACLTRLRLKVPLNVTIENAKSSIGEVEAHKEIELKDKRAILDMALMKLKPEERSITTLFYYKEYSLKEIAHISDLSISNVKTILHRSRKKLLETLRKMGIKENTF